MTVSISNTNLTDNFETWRLNTNLIATVISNNVITVNPGGDSNRGGFSKGDAHVGGTFSSSVLRTNNLRSGNTSDDGSWLNVYSNATINATTLSVTSNTIFQGNVNFATSGANRLIMGDISRIRMTGGVRGQFLRMEDENDVLNFKSLTLRDLADLSSNSAHLILSGANTTFSDNNDSPHLILSNGVDRARFFMASGAIGESDVYLSLVDDDGDSKFVITDSTNTEIFSVDSDGRLSLTSNVELGGVSSSGNILPELGQDDQHDLGAPNREWRNLWVDGVANIDELSIATGSGQGVSTSLIPKTDAAGNLGSQTRKWGTVWSDTTNGGAGVFKGLGVSQNLNANGNLTIGGSTTLTGSATFSNTVTVTGKTVHNGNTVFSSNAAFQDELVVTGNTFLSGDVELGNDSTDTITVKGNFANVSVEGLSTFDGNMRVNSSWLEIDTDIRGDLTPDADDGDGHYDLGSTSERWNAVYANNAYANNLFLDNNATINGSLTVQGDVTLATGTVVSAPEGTFTDLTVTGGSDLQGDVDIGDASGDTVTINASIDSNIIPTGTRNIGSASSQWNNLYFSGSLYDGTTNIIGKNNKLHANNTISDGTIRSNMLETVADLTAQQYGSSTAIPVVTVNNKGIVTAIGTTTVAGVSSFTYATGTFTIGTADGSDFTASVPNATTSVKGIASFNTNDFGVQSGAVSIKSGGVSTSQLADVADLTAGTYGDGVQVPTITVNAKGQITGVTANSIPLAARAVHGIASFDPVAFAVASNGHVSLAGGSSGAVLSVSGTTNEVSVSRTDGAVTIGLPDDVTIAGQLNVTENLVVSGNLIMNGGSSAVFKAAEEVNIEDNVIVLNSNEGGVPSLDAGFIVERGTSDNKSFLWDESEGEWTLGSERIVAKTFEGTSSNVEFSLVAGNYLVSNGISSWSGGPNGDDVAYAKRNTKFSVDATSLNTASKVVARNASGNFAAGIITAALSGNASTASKWSNARTVTFDGVNGVVTGSFEIDGSSDVSSVVLGLATGSVTSTHLATNSVGADELANEAVDTAAIAADAVTGDKIVDNTIGSEHFKQGAITSTVLGNDTVKQTNIADDAVGKDQLKDQVTLHIKSSSGTILKTLYAVGDPDL